MDIAILLFEGLTALDAIGPYDVFRNLPSADVRFVAKRPGVHRDQAGRLGLETEFALTDMPQPDVLVVPGGYGVERVIRDDETLDWVRAAHEHTTWTTSVCTGSLILGAAGLLDGLPATTHWAQHDRLESFGATPTLERVVRHGKIVTAAGVSSGIDMALTLIALMDGDASAQAIQLVVEYDPQPPFDAGSPAKAPTEIVDLVRELAAARLEQVRAEVAAEASAG